MRFLAFTYRIVEYVYIPQTAAAARRISAQSLCTINSCIQRFKPREVKLTNEWY